MHTDLLSTIAAAGFAVAVMHAAIPTHWLPFVLAARGQGWSRARTLAIVGVAGGAHVVFTTILGALIVWAGVEISESLGHLFLLIAGGALALFGGVYIVRHLRGKNHEHHHSLSRLWDRRRRPHAHGHEQHHHHDALPSGHAHAHDHEFDRSDRVAVGALISMLTFSPCESFLPVYLTAAEWGWGGFAMLSVTLAVATLGSMLLLTWLASLGLERMRLAFLDRYESLIVGVLLVLLGIAVVLLELQHA